MTVKQEVLQILADAAEPLTSLTIFDKCSEASNRSAVSVALSGLKNEDLVEPAGKSEVEGETAFVLWQITDEGRAELEAIKLAENDAGGGEPKAEGRRQKAKGKKARKKARKVQRKSATSRAAPPAPVRWALAEDGTLILTGTNREISAKKAREVVDLVRSFPADQLFRLIAFLRALDKGEA